MEKLPLSSADTAVLVPLIVTVANETVLPSEAETFPVTVLFCAIIIRAGKQSVTSSSNFFMQLIFLLEKNSKAARCITMLQFCIALFLKHEF